MEFTLKQLFNLVDGRLSTEMGDIYTMLNHITGENLYTHHLPVAMKYVEKIKPAWYRMVKIKLDNIKWIVGDDFDELMDYIDEKYPNDVYDIPRLSDYQKEEFDAYMIENSLL